MRKLSSLVSLRDSTAGSSHVSPNALSRLDGDVIRIPRDPILVTPVRGEDAPELTELLNAIILRGGTTAYEEPFAAEELSIAMLIGSDVIQCVVAREEHSGLAVGFQSLIYSNVLPLGVFDIATYTRAGLTRCGVGSALFATTLSFAQGSDVQALNATIRADNHCGLAFYDRLGFIDHDLYGQTLLKSGVKVGRISKRFPIPH